MSLNFDPILIINVLLCFVILVFGFGGFKKTKNTVPLYVGLAFGLFGISHLATLIGLKDALAGVLITLRILAYLLVVFALYRFFSSDHFRR